MTKPTIALTELIEKGADADLLKHMIQFVAQRMREFDVEGLCGAGFDVNSPDRTNSRNSYRGRLGQTCASDVDLTPPQTTWSSPTTSTTSPASLSHALVKMGVCLEIGLGLPGYRDNTYSACEIDRHLNPQDSLLGHIT